MFVPDPAIRARIDLPGAVPLETVSQMLRAARVAVISSRGFESFSYAALESLAAALREALPAPELVGSSES